MAVSLVCKKCSTPHSFEARVGFREECSRCGEDLHSCEHCDFFDPNAYNNCREPSADVVKVKDRANFCEYFQPHASSGGALQKDKLLSAAESLFKKKES